MKPDIKIVNTHEAKPHLSRLAEEALVAQVSRRTGFLKDHADVPADFDRMVAEEITAAFEGQESDGRGICADPAPTPTPE